MKYTAQVKIMPLKELLDPQGKAIMGSLHNLGLTNIEGLRVGKHITLSVNAGSADEAKGIVEKACQDLLANLVMESYEITIDEQ